jgi:hypothetical protein
VLVHVQVVKPAVLQRRQHTAITPKKRAGSEPTPGRKGREVSSEALSLVYGPPSVRSEEGVKRRACASVQSREGVRRRACGHPRPQREGGSIRGALSALWAPICAF